MTIASPNLALERAGLDDIEIVSALMNAAFDPRFGEAWTPGQLRTLFAVPGTGVCLAHLNGHAVGFCAARLAGPESELLLLAVAPEYRRQGVGVALLSFWVNWAKTSGANDCFLEMRADNPARSLYERAHFVECGRRPDYYLGQDGIRRDAITMRYDPG